ncbi:alpha/beta-Hydrolase [Glarea lozoyensis ATCC 20868]|uniref:Alpha/beta-Hydrolase n=1 Tax=Glarea lozoyensis (strain ATCC 20868 / MF5171) TaxID=1116229 RepID=S3D8G8_GLAL2|nr:alpha/beta-Hydrolase [Glarea lozoyensis ATCC 20868]EPE33449.1 alpha/beta-Hydrolase [Glarea lozoyensis ATCC 20868]
MVKASIWRGLMAVGMKIHRFAEPKPPAPNFKITIPSRLSPKGGTFKLVFYVPDSYWTAPEGYRYPVVVNFHGGGFTLGTGTDDARWATTVCTTVDAILVSVEYRLAPEYPFSVGVEDGSDAVLYLASHADELQIDPHRMALSGFSAGGNFAFTVPLMLHDLGNDAGKRVLAENNPIHKRNKKSNDSLYPPSSRHGGEPLSATSSAASSTPSLNSRPSFVSEASSGSILKLSDLEPTALEINQEIPDYTIRAIVSFYPPTDFRTTREEKRKTNPQPAKNLPPMLTNLFDDSYLFPTADIDFSDPYLSPAAASDDFLRAAYPEDIVLYTCEYDMLNAEGVAFGERLTHPSMNKKVHGGLVKESVHAFDKKPNPIKFPESADRIYSEACAELTRIFGGRSSFEDRRQLDKVKSVDRFEERDEPYKKGDDEEALIDGIQTLKGAGSSSHS